MCQPSALYVLPKGDYKAGLGAAISAGYNFNTHQALEVELISFKTETEEHFITPIYGEKTKLTAVPLLLTYRYSIALGKGFGVFAGVSAGGSMEKHDLTATYPNGIPLLQPAGVYHYRETKNRFVYGGQIGATYDFTPQMSAVMAVKVLAAEGSVAPSGYTTLQLGLKFRF